MKQNFVPLELPVLAVMGCKNSVSPSLDIPSVISVTISPKTTVVDRETTQPTMTPLVAFVFMLFTLVIPPCFAALATMIGTGGLG
jgi:Fe2+ transport system protein B